jgi:hypothetical protein
VGSSGLCNGKALELCSSGPGDEQEISTAALAVVEREIDRPAAEFNELAELDSTMPPEQRQSVGLAPSMRPWRIGQVTGLKERPRRASK